MDDLLASSQIVRRNEVTVCVARGTKCQCSRNSCDAFSNKMVAPTLSRRVSEGSSVLKLLGTASSSFLFHSEWPRANKPKHHLRWLLRYYNTQSKPQSVGSWMKISFRYCCTALPPPPFRLAQPPDRRTDKQIVLHTIYNFLSFALYYSIGR